MTMLEPGARSVPRGVASLVGPLLLGTSCAVALSVGACHTRDENAVVTSGSGSVRPRASAAPVPVDRLAKGELAAGSLTAFGFPVPELMTLDATFADAVHASGSVTPDALSNYVRQRVSVEHVEIGAGRTIFPKVRIRGGAQQRVYRIEVVSEGPKTLLVIRDITPPPMVQGLSEAERWRRAGMTPDGKPLNPKQMQ